MAITVLVTLLRVSILPSNYQYSMRLYSFKTFVTGALALQPVVSEQLVLQEPVAIADSELGSDALDADNMDCDIMPRRPIPWGEINFLHTTDTHGWLPGHILEPEFSADWGDYVSFISHMKKLADKRKSDLLVVDTGDRHDGNGLSDATYPDGEVSQRIFREADFDIVTLGNHELYRQEVTSQEYEIMRPYFGDKYVSSNIEYRLADGSWVPIGNKYRVFNTKNNNYKVLAFGFLFNFEGNDVNSHVIHVEDVVEEEWFKEVLQTPDLDFILLACHIPVRYFTEFDTLISAIRKVHPTIPIQGLGGHVHIRDYRVFDDYATGLGSGRFLETVGWAGVNFTDSDVPSFGRLYIDFNKEALAEHSKTTVEGEQGDFFTDKGSQISKEIDEWRDRLNLTDVITCVPQSYYTNRAPYPGKNNLFTLLETEVLPLLEGEGERNEHARFILANTGSIRFDLFKGPYTKDSGYIVSPFMNNWVYLPEVPLAKAKKFLPLLNSLDHVFVSDEPYDEKYNISRDFSELGTASHIGQHQYEDRELDSEFMDGLVSVQAKLSQGYKTYDDYGHDGDDTLHRPWTAYWTPNVIQATQNVDKSTEAVDIIFYDFMLPFIEDVLDSLKMENYKDSVRYYGGERVIELLPRYFAKLSNNEC